MSTYKTDPQTVTRMGREAAVFIEREYSAQREEDSIAHAWREIMKRGSIRRPPVNAFLVQGGSPCQTQATLSHLFHLSFFNHKPQAAGEGASTALSLTRPSRRTTIDESWLDPSQPREPGEPPVEEGLRYIYERYNLLFI